MGLMHAATHFYDAHLGFCFRCYFEKLAADTATSESIYYQQGAGPCQQYVSV